jgi:peptide/nickel transport system substrate-binding protein
LKRREFLKSGAALAGAAPIAGGIRTARSETPRDTLLVLVENGPNSLDIHGVGTTFRSYVACWNLSDRLLTFGRKTLPDGGFSYDYTKIEPELAEDFTLSPEGMSVTFKLRRDATLHDGAPVTAEDVKWSLDRAVAVGGFPVFQMAAGSLKKPEQFVVLDDRFPPKRQAHIAGSRRCGPSDLQFEARPQSCLRQGSLGAGVDEDQ